MANANNYPYVDASARPCQDYADEQDLFVKPEKCNFKVKEVNFLGMIIGQNRPRMDPEKVQAILEWLKPTCFKGVIQQA
ncbi:hypothetical protein SERLADRAFT_432246 [Serpula lacrymans var. lacrymans S7.9]|uniref:Reverse transcriptase domain-containing protein n=1 Tax=Serpula lacrymans var. lacrymans (strain S7.9) TaxID=578457 RepID=F8NEM2_SERL9|nr:uncharacterized protein SERLADRAFT_432246 [Serpula lacrymans var. lacrymans S7.9]EGO30656.1 hypothetical protein SERLADRAFT_432246 [Serpula lacrymans var. lacrymans S7.9]